MRKSSCPNSQTGAAYFSINKAGRYIKPIICNTPTLSLLDEEIANAILKDCIERIDATFQQCKSSGNFTTFAMNACSRLYIELLELIEPFETSI